MDNSRMLSITAVFLLGYVVGCRHNKEIDARQAAGVLGPTHNRRQRFVLACVLVLGTISSIALLAIFAPERSNEGYRRRRLDLDRSVAVGFDGNPIGPAGEAGAREVHVRSMCRCPGGSLAVPPPASEVGIDTSIVQPPSSVAGQHKRFFMHPPVEGTSCECMENHEAAEPTWDMFLNKLRRRCPNPKFPGNYPWEIMPDLGVEERLPMFAGVLSYESPLSLNGTLHNWRDLGLFRRIDARGIFVQLNHRSSMDDQVVDEYHSFLEPNEHVPITAMGSPEENINPGLAISKFCRAAESHPDGHPDGENLLLFLEKDWSLWGGDHYHVRHIEEVFGSISTLIQRGVSMVRLKQLSQEVRGDPKAWNCPANGVPWKCVTAHRHRWSNQPSVISCKWFLRYLEPFALLDDPIMYGCRDSFQDNRYTDWEEAMQDGRVAWTNSQWIVATITMPDPRMFFHEEIDG